MTDDEQPAQTTIVQIVHTLPAKANGVEVLNLFRDSRIDRILAVFLGPDRVLAYSRASRPEQVNFASILDGKAIADMKTEPLDLSKLKVLPLAQRHSLTTVDGILIDPDSVAKPCSDRMTSQIDIAPTILGLLGMDYYSQFYGVDVFQQAPGHERAFLGTYQLLGYLRSGKLVQLSPHRKVETLRPAYGWDEPQPPLPEDPALTLQAISYYQTAAEEFASGKMRMPERLPEPPAARSTTVPMQAAGK